MTTRTFRTEQTIQCVRIYSECERIVEVCSALSNNKRLCLLQELISMNSGTLREIHDRTSSKTGLSHRETTHKYLEQLVEASLINKGLRDSGDIEYYVEDEEVLIQFTENS